jgi:hypothetical protein
VFREDLLNRLRRNTLIQGDNPQDDRDLTKPVSGQRSQLGGELDCKVL